MKGPSVVSTVPLETRTTVAVSGSCRRPPKTQAPVDFNSASSMPSCLWNCCICSSVIGALAWPSTLWTDNRYCGIVDSLLWLGGVGPAAHSITERPEPRSTAVAGSGACGRCAPLVERGGVDHAAHVCVQVLH